MLEILQFIFSSLWVYMGTAFLLGTVASAFAAALALVFGGRRDVQG